MRVLYIVLKVLGAGILILLVVGICAKWGQYIFHLGSMRYKSKILLKSLVGFFSLNIGFWMINKKDDFT